MIMKNIIGGIDTPKLIAIVKRYFKVYYDY
jgi:hypothetical protein